MRARASGKAEGAKRQQSSDKFSPTLEPNRRVRASIGVGGLYCLCGDPRRKSVARTARGAGKGI